jgi:predicted transcriptional regulator
MIEAIVGSTSAERVLLFLAAREEGYATEIAKSFDTSLSQIQKQLERMERDGLLINKKVGNTRVYSFNPRYVFVDELKALLEKAISMCPDSLQEELLMNRRRPRKKNKPLKSYES